MKKLILILMILLTASLCFGEDKEAVKDTTVTLSISALQKQKEAVRAELERQLKNLEDGKKFVTMTEQNILKLQATYNTLDAIERDESLQVKKKSKK